MGADAPVNGRFYTVWNQFTPVEGHRPVTRFRDVGSPGRVTSVGRVNLLGYAMMEPSWRRSDSRVVSEACSQTRPDPICMNVLVLHRDRNVHQIVERA